MHQLELIRRRPAVDRRHVEPAAPERLAQRGELAAILVDEHVPAVTILDTEPVAPRELRVDLHDAHLRDLWGS